LTRHPQVADGLASGALRSEQARAIVGAIDGLLAN
jgi:hypothetical protein